MHSGATHQPRLAAFDPATGVVDPTWVPKPNKQVSGVRVGRYDPCGRRRLHERQQGTYRRVAVYRLV